MTGSVPSSPSVDATAHRLFAAPQAGNAALAGVYLVPWNCTYPRRFKDISSTGVALLFPGKQCASFGPHGIIALVALIVHLVAWFVMAIKDCDLNPISKSLLGQANPAAWARIAPLQIITVVVYHFLLG